MVRRGYQLVPGAVEWIDQTLKRLRLEPIPASYRPAVAVKRQARFYMTPVRYRGGVAWFKASLAHAPGLVRGLRDEMTIQRAFADYERLNRTHFDSPSFIGGSVGGDRGWLLRRYWTGMYAGDVVDYFGLSPSFVRLVKPGAMALVVRDAGRMTAFMRRRLRLPVHDAGWYGLDFDYYQHQMFPKLLRHRLNPGWTKKDIERWRQLIKNQRLFLKRQATVFTHGDLYPNNIMLTGHGAKRTIVLFDWELAHYNVPAFDAVMVWLMAWRHPRWQKEFAAACWRWLPRTPENRIGWSLAQLSLATRLLGFTFFRLSNTRPQQYPPLPAKYRAIVHQMFLVMVKHIEEAVESLPIKS